MTTVRDEHNQYDELDLVQILQEVYKRKWIVAGVTLLAGILMAGYSLTKSNVYESSAALIVREPQQVIERDGEMPEPQPGETLSVETLQTLTESTQITWALFESTLEKGILKADTGQVLDKQAMFSAFQSNLSTELKKQQNRRGGGSVELLPILVLRVRANAPEIAQAIANEWASLVESKSGEIYAEGVEALDTFIGEMYTKSNETLAKLEGSLKDKELEASLTLKKARLETLTEKIGMLEDKILEIDIDLAVDEVAIEEGKKRIQDQQVNDEWIGTVAEDALLKNIPYPFSQDGLSEQALKVLALSEQKVRQTESLRTFRREQNLLGKEKRFAHCQLDLERILAEKAKVEDELPAVETAINTLTEQLQEIPETLVLEKAITDDALWNLYVADKERDPKKLPPLKTETLNPLYQSTRETIVDLTSKAETLRGGTVQLEVSEKAVLALAEELESEIDMITEELNRRQTALEATQTSIALLRDDYLEEKKVIEELTLKSIRTKAERATREGLRTTLTAEAQTLEESISQFELDIEVLTREADKTRDVRTAIASKAEEAALLQVAMEQAKGTGTTILYNAQANPDKIAPTRSKMVLAAMLAGFLGSVFVVCAGRLLRETNSPTKSEG